MMSLSVPVLVLGIAPAASLLTLLIYIGLWIRQCWTHRIVLPITRHEGLDGQAEGLKDPYDCVAQPHAADVGVSINELDFWRQTWRKSLAMLVAMILACTYTSFLVLRPGWKYSPATPNGSWNLLLASDMVTLALTTFNIVKWGPGHWSTTMLLFFDCMTRMVALLFSILLARATSNGLDKNAAVCTLLLPLHLLPLVVISTVRRGPPQRIDASEVYTSELLDSGVPDDAVLGDKVSNVDCQAQATVPEVLLFQHAAAILVRGRLADLGHVLRLPILGSVRRAKHQYQQIKESRRHFRRQPERWKGWRLIWCLAKANNRALIQLVLFSALNAAAFYVPPLFLNLYLGNLELDPGRTNLAWGWFAAVGLLVSKIGLNVLSAGVWAYTTRNVNTSIDLQVKTLLYRKTLVVRDYAGDAAATGAATVGEGDEEESDNDADDEDLDESGSKGQIMTLFDNDAGRVGDFVHHLDSLVGAPVEIVTAGLFCYRLLGTSALVGLAGALVLMPINHYASKFIVRAEEGLMRATERRTSMMNEVLGGMRMIKFLAWERPYQKRIRAIRKEELHWQTRNYQAEVAMDVLWSLVPVVVNVVAFMHYTLVQKKHLTPSIAFTAISILGELQYALMAIPQTVVDALQGLVSVRRIEKYLCAAEIDTPAHRTKDSQISLDGVTLTWHRSFSSIETDMDGHDAAFRLEGVTLKLPDGKLTLVSGGTGSGKSLLLRGLLGEVEVLSGSLEYPRSFPNDIHHGLLASSGPDWILTGTVAYVPQQAWLQNTSIRLNITFFAPWDEIRYHRVLEACALVDDLNALAKGDETKVQENGANLSGGQKARVSLARAVYSRAEIVYIDDVLSSVDAHTAKHIVQQCFQGELLRGRTVLIVSHLTSLIRPIAAYRVILKKGKVVYAGDPTIRRQSDGQRSPRADSVRGLSDHDDDEDSEDSEDNGSEDDHSDDDDDEGVLAGNENPKVVRNAESLNGQRKIERPLSRLEDWTSKLEVGLNGRAISHDTEEHANSPKRPAKSIADVDGEEDDELKFGSGQVSFEVWKAYFKSLGGMWFAAILGICLLCTMAAEVAQMRWLQYWTSSDEGFGRSVSFYAIGYAIISFSGVLAGVAETSLVFYGSIQSSWSLHEGLLERVLFAPVSFFNRTSRGKILNRFASDMEALDSETAENLSQTISHLITAVVSIASVTYIGGLPVLLVVCLVLLIVRNVASVYSRTARQLRRLEASTESPMYALYGETIAGLGIIRAFGAGTMMMDRMMKIANAHSVVYFWSHTIDLWLSLRFNIISSFVVGISAMIILITPGISAAQAGFGLSFALELSEAMLWLLRTFVDLERNMVGVERIREYSSVEQEAPETLDPRPPQAWPHAGIIDVRNLFVRYGPEKPNVLHGISFKTRPGEKIGIVGATGSGKSTLAQTLLRIVEPRSGSIIIDGIDVSLIGLKDLRSRITTLPQDPIFFKGTLRNTLDAFDEYSDEELFQALEKAQLLSPGQKSGSASDQNSKFSDLLYPVSEGGDNFSMGERQLICMARALLADNRIVVMDEATGSIDYDLETKISNTIREHFTNATVLTIAHRLRTIMDSDRVLVLDQGRIVEFASPPDLLNDPNSRLSSLYKASGELEAI